MALASNAAASTSETRFTAAWRELAESPTALAALGVVVLLIALALLAPWVAPQNPYDLGQLSVMDNMLPPGARGFDGKLYLLGTDDQGRDMLSAILYGLRLSLFVGATATAIALALGTAVGIIAAHVGGTPRHGADAAGRHSVVVPGDSDRVDPARHPRQGRRQGGDRAGVGAMGLLCPHHPRLGDGRAAARVHGGRPLPGLAAVAHRHASSPPECVPAA